MRVAAIGILSLSLIGMLAPMHTARARAAAVPLPGGKRVLMLGGIGATTRPVDEIVGLP